MEILLMKELFKVFIEDFRDLWCSWFKQIKEQK